ncbi:MAG: acyltransferase domain-containing protein [Acutalibacteraceae bacterium]
MIELKYLNQIGLSKELEENCKAYFKKNEKRVLGRYNKAKNNYRSSLHCCSDMMRLCVALMLLEDTKKKYDQLKIDEKIFLDTASDIGIWCKNNSDKGLAEYLWIENHLKAELFRLGRLQFQLRQLPNWDNHLKKCGINSGDTVLNIHIPQGMPLAIDECQKSISQAREFFKNHFPEKRIAAFVCESWLLYPKNEEFMSANSNIIQFMKLFEIIGSIPYSTQAIERVFGKKRLFVSSYSENTTLQKQLKAYLKSGSKPGIGIGIIKY